MLFHLNFTVTVLCTYVVTVLVKSPDSVAVRILARFIEITMIKCETVLMPVFFRVCYARKNRSAFSISEILR